MTHICVFNLTTIGSDNGLTPGRRQAIIWTNDGIALIGPSGTHFSEILIEIHSFSFQKIYLKISSAKWRLFCLGLNVFQRFKWQSHPNMEPETACVCRCLGTCHCHTINRQSTDYEFNFVLWNVNFRFFESESSASTSWRHSKWLPQSRVNITFNVHCRKH